MQHKWNDTDGVEKPWHSGERGGGDLSQRHFVHHKSLTWNGLVSNPGFQGGRPATERLNHGSCLSKPYLFPKVRVKKKFEEHTRHTEIYSETVTRGDLASTTPLTYRGVQD